MFLQALPFQLPFLGSISPARVKAKSGCKCVPPRIKSLRRRRNFSRKSLRGSSRFGTKGNGPRHIILAAAEAKPAAQPAKQARDLISGKEKDLPAWNDAAGTIRWKNKHTAPAKIQKIRSGRISKIVIVRPTNHSLMPQCVAG